ncbi:hypothetical protein ACFL0C_00095 [Patescibacteria group bacterium]
MASSNPFYDIVGGHYPGEPIPRERPPQGNLPEARYMDASNIINDYLRAVSKELEDHSVSEQAKKYFLYDLERTLTLSVSPQEQTYDPVRALEFGDEEDVAGVQLKIDLAPWKWAQDPEGMAKKTVKGWVNDFANWNDFSNYLELSQLWDPLLKGDEVGALAALSFEAHPDEGISSTFRPFQLEGLGETHTVLHKGVKGADGIRREARADADLNHETAGSFKNFVKKGKSTGARNKAFNSHINTTVLSTSLDLKEALIRGDIIGADNIKVANAFNKKADLLRATNGFLNKGNNRIFELSNGVTEAGISGGMGALTKELNKISLLGGDTSKARKVFNELFDANGPIEELGKLIEDTKKWYEVPANATNAERANFDKWVKPLEKMHGEVSGLKNYDISNHLSAKNLKGKLDAIEEKYTRSGPFKGGIDRMHENIARELASGPVGNLIRNTNGINGAKNKLYVLQEVLRQYRIEDFNDLIEQLESKGLLGVVAEMAWALVRKRLDGFTPAALAKEFMDNLQWFGLVYEPGKGYKWVNSIINSKRLGWLFNNTQKVKYVVDGKEFLLIFAGNKSLKGALGFYKRLSKTDDFKLTSNQFLRLLNGETVGELKDKFEESEEFLKWLLKINPQLKLTFVDGKIADTEENIEKLLGLFGSLQERAGNKNFISIFQNKAGVMQKVSARLNQLQDRVGKYLKWLAPVSYVKNILAKEGAKLVTAAVSKLVSKLVAGAVTEATGGLGALVWPLIEKTVQYILNKTLDVAVKVLESVRKADFSIVDDFVTWSAQTMFKTLGIVVGCCSMVFLPFIIIFIIFLSAITPVDPTRMGEEGLGSPIAGAGGPTVLCTACCGPDSPADCEGPTCSEPPTVDECPISESVGCFNFTDASSWESQLHYDVVFNAAETFRNSQGTYVNKLCALDGPITIQWGNVACGWASDGANTITFGNGQCWQYTMGNPQILGLFAHETGHIYDPGYGDEHACVEDAARREGQMEVYASTCVTAGIDEDWANVIEMYTAARCGYSSTRYPLHAACAQQIMQ